MKCKAKKDISWYGVHKGDEFSFELTKNGNYRLSHGERCSPEWFFEHYEIIEGSAINTAEAEARKETATMEKKTIVEKVYRPANTARPIWKEVERKRIRVFLFDSMYKGKRTSTTLLWRCRYKQGQIDDLYHGCDYHFGGHNPIPVTDWFRGIPLNQMLDWCKANGLTNMQELAETITITYADCSKPEPLNIGGITKAN